MTYQKPSSSTLFIDMPGQADIEDCKRFVDELVEFCRSEGFRYKVAALDEVSMDFDEKIVDIRQKYIY